jgi:mono/diheme cytochrome c family protein
METMNNRAKCGSQRHPWLFVSLATVALVVAGAGEAAGQTAACTEWTVPERRVRAANPLSLEQTDLRRAREIFLRECSSCHGETGQNDGPDTSKTDMTCAPPLSDPALLARSDGELFWKIREGRESMPNTRDVLRDQDRWVLVNYLRTLMQP